MYSIRSSVSNESRHLWSLMVLCLLVLPICLHGEELGEDDVRAAVETWVRSVTADARPDVIVDTMESFTVDGVTMAFIAHLLGEGFCLCGADDLVLPVYFYCPHGAYDPQDPSYQYVLWEIESRLKVLREGLKKGDPTVRRHGRALARRASFWRDLMAGRAPVKVDDARAEPTKVELNLTTHWKQNYPFNDFCPMGDGGRCVVGCVATAAAQIMRYWAWPPAGVGSYSYWWDGDQSCGGNVGGEELSATFSDPYDWHNMPNQCSSGCSSEEREALAELNFEVGVAIDMNYGVCGSGASTGNVEYALEEFFRYDPDATFGWRDIDAMTDEIQWLRPIEFRGQDYQGSDGYRGHAWVVCGYNKGTDPDRQFKMNLGWGGGGDGWYSCDHIDVDHNEIDDFWDNQKHLTRIAPQGAVRFVGDHDPGDGSPDNPYHDIEEALSLAPDYTTLIFKAGSVNTFSAPSLVIDKPLILKGAGVVIQR